MTQIQQLYAVEKYCVENNYTSDKIKHHRQLHPIPVLKVLYEKLKNQLITCLPESPLGKALHYTLARWDKLNVYTQNGKLRIDNNRIEKPSAERIICLQAIMKLHREV